MTDTYRPRRASARWLNGDCPRGVLAIFDSGDRFADRYTVFYAEPIPDGPGRWPWISYRGMSEHPTHPQGIGVYGEMPAHEVAAYRRRVYRQSSRWTDLPDEVRAVVRRDLT